MGTNTYAYMKEYRKSHPEMRNKLRKLNYARGRKHDLHSGCPWTHRDEVFILSSPGKMTDRQTASLLGRSVQAIQTKRLRLQKQQKGGD